MTIAATTTVVRYVGDGTQRVWPVPFPFFVPQDVRARLAASEMEGRELVYGTEYTVDKEEGGRAVCAVPVGQVLSLWLELPITQSMELTGAGYLSPPDLEAAFDYRALVEQQLAEKILRTVKVPVGSEITPETLIADVFAAYNGAKVAQIGAETAKNEAEALVDAGVLRVTAEGDVQVARVMTEGGTQTARVTTEGTTQITRVQQEIRLAVTSAADAQRDAVLAGVHAAKAQQEADRAATEANRAEQVVRMAEGTQNFEATWVLEQDVAAGDILPLPGSLMYFPGRNMVRLSFEGLLCYQGRQFEEVQGATAQSSSNTLRLLFPVKAGRMFNVWISAMLIQP